MYGDGEPVFTKATGEFEYSFKQRNDDTNLTYTVEVCTDLATGSWTDAGTTGVNTGTAGAYNNMKHTISVDQTQTYIRLKISR